MTVSNTEGVWGRGGRKEGKGAGELVGWESYPGRFRYCILKTSN